MVTRRQGKLTERQLAKLEAQVKKNLLRSVFETFIAGGHVDPSGKSEEELQHALVLALKDFAEQKELNLLVDYRTSLLQHAREFARREKAPIAILFYATWFEHWINSLLNTRGHLLGLTPNEIKLCMRQTGLHAKFVCFPLFLKLPRLAASHITTVRECSDLRNAFVHYKFPVNSMDDDQKKTNKVVTTSEKTVRYLSNYELRHIFKRAKKRVQKLV